MTAISNNDIARAIYLVSKDKSGAPQSQIYKKIIDFLARRHLLSKAPSILLALEKIVNHEEGKVMVKVKSAEKLSEQAKMNLVQTLKKRYSAKDISLVENLDKKLLGGLRLEVNDEVIDLSIQNKIKKLQAYLTKPA